MGGVSGDIFLYLGIIIVIAAVVAFLLKLAKQPQILSYVLAGILITPVFKLITDTTIIDSLSMIGIAFLLFLVGLEMDLKSLRNVAKVSVFGGTAQIAILFGLSYVLALLLGFLNREAAYIGLMMSFSSTMVVMKLLSDKRQLNTLHGRIAVGILLLEDLIAIFALSLLSSLGGFSLSLVGLAALKFALLFGIAYLASKYLFPKIFEFAAKKQELMLISSLAVCFLFSLGFYALNFSIAIGAFIAGISLGSLKYSLHIISKVKSLRDFFALLFFVSLGMTLSLDVIKNMWLPLIVFTTLVLVIKPIITMFICSLFRYTKKPSFITAISLSEIGEFSLIIATQGLLLGHITQETFSLVVMVTLISITETTYLLQFDNWFYNFLKKPLKLFDYFNTKSLEFLPSEVKPSIILCGHNRIGFSVLRKLKKFKKKVLVIDYNPEVIEQLVKEDYHCIYGDATDDEILERMHLSKIKMLISTIPTVNETSLLIKKVREVNKKAKIIVTASEIDSALKFYKLGADYVILPHFLGGEHVSGLITKVHHQKVDLKDEKKCHIKQLKERKNTGQEHPVETH